LVDQWGRFGEGARGKWLWGRELENFRKSEVCAPGGGRKKPAENRTGISLAFLVPGRGEGVKVVTTKIERLL